MKQPSLRFINSTVLHILAMLLMLLDHMWGTVLCGNDWMTCLGRMAYPIFAFLLVEGYFHTRNLKKYFLRLLIGAVLSEIPFNLMMGGYWLDPFDQNVLWTLSIGLACIHLSEKARTALAKRLANRQASPVSDHPQPNGQAVLPRRAVSPWLRPLTSLYLPAVWVSILIFLIGSLLALITFVDYYYFGILMIGTFYAFRGTRWWHRLGQLAGMILINCVLFEGMHFDMTLLGHTFDILRQGLAVFALIPIWLYNGKKGGGGKPFQAVCYLFYPVHILILSLLALL